MPSESTNNRKEGRSLQNDVVNGEQSDGDAVNTSYTDPHEDVRIAAPIPGAYFLSICEEPEIALYVRGPGGLLQARLFAVSHYHTLLVKALNDLHIMQIFVQSRDQCIIEALNLPNIGLDAVIMQLEQLLCSGIPFTAGELLALHARLAPVLLGLDNLIGQNVTEVAGAVVGCHDQLQ